MCTGGIPAGRSGRLCAAMTSPIPISTDRVEAFCRKWRIQEFSLFGSVLRPDFRPDSDVDVLVAFEPGAVWDFDDYDSMESELGNMFGRKIDLVERSRVVNPFRRHHILNNRRIIYVAA